MTLHHAFNPDAWDQSRHERLDRQEIDAAKQEAMRATREGFSIVKPGRWKVTRQDGVARLEVFASDPYAELNQ